MAGDPVDVLDSWRGAFGDRYVERNPATAETVAEAATVFARIVDTAGVRPDVRSVLEVGANIGINLRGLRRVLGRDARLAALEPNPRACARLREDADLALAEVIEADAYRVPVPDGAYDLVFTSGVLIHVPPARLPEAMREIVRVARRLVLCSEYFSHSAVEVPYQGHAGMLWKRDFARAYLEHCPGLAVAAYGFLWQQEFPHFDDLTWWMFRKTGDGAA